MIAKERATIGRPPRAFCGGALMDSDNGRNTRTCGLFSTVHSSSNRKGPVECVAEHDETRQDKEGRRQQRSAGGPVGALCLFSGGTGRPFLHRAHASSAVERLDDVALVPRVPIYCCGNRRQDMNRMWYRGLIAVVLSLAAAGPTELQAQQSAQLRAPDVIDGTDAAARSWRPC